MVVVNKVIKDVPITIKLIRTIDEKIVKYLKKKAPFLPFINFILLGFEFIAYAPNGFKFPFIGNTL